MSVTNNEERSQFLPPVFSETKILTKLDFPLLMVSTSVDNIKWLFSWADTNEGRDITIGGDDVIEDKWFALPISENRFEQIVEEKISLREAILFHETKLFLITSHRPLNDPSDILYWKHLKPGSVPNELLPILDISVKGKSLMPSKKESTIQLESHLLFVKEQDNGIPLETVGPYMDYMQKILRWASNFVLNGPPKEMVIPKKIGRLRLSSISPGSIRMLTETYDTKKETGVSTVKAIELIKEFLENVKSVDAVENFQDMIGKEALSNVYYLMRLLQQQKINMNLKAVSGEGVANSITLSFEEVNAQVRRLETYFKKEATVSEIVIKLSDDAIEKLNRPITGQGGWQSLAERLKGLVNPEDKSIVLTPQETERIIRYSQLYGQGGWQGRLEPILMELRKLGLIFSDLR